MLQAGDSCYSVIFAVSEFAVCRHGVALEGSCISRDDLLEDILQSQSLTVEEVSEFLMMRHKIPYISFSDSETFVVPVCHPDLMEGLVSADVWVLHHSKSNTFVKTGEHGSLLRQQSSYCAASDSEAVVAEPGGQTVDRHRVQKVHLGAEGREASVEVRVLQRRERSIATDYVTVLAVNGRTVYLLDDFHGDHLVAYAVPVSEETRAREIGFFRIDHLICKNLSLPHAHERIHSNF